ncbi:hypothetical protein [Neoroseomonas lacus]|uniref:Uncharacterized protein n=1 Tax=Neoroseomonas lacus TaxID=287609 RepID=A0A917NLW3_9PROT|nr:hypothetical protein [Neoroseomonas lacus]GGJ10486.1 hypothetical protein GCM10011320_17010 [Neoroseomonas lacus]
MDAEEFRRSLDEAAPPDGLPTPLLALWWDARGDWQRAHEAAQAGEDADSAWVHAYLHHREGDLANAGYWYRRAGKPTAGMPLDEEASAILATLLAR